MELLDLYDDNGKKIEKTIKRGEKFDEGNIMLSVIFIRNSNNMFLIQKASKDRKNKYTSTGGHVIHNEDGLTTIIREVKEELGLDIKKEEIKKLDLTKHPSRPCLINVYLLEKDIDINTLTLQKEEVEEVKWMSEQEILSLINKDLFLESHGYLFKKYFTNEIIKVCTTEDANMLNKLLTDLINDERKYDDNINENFIVSSFYENIYTDKNKCLLAVKNNNNIIGYLYGYVCENNVDKEKTAIIDALYVENLYRNKGLGKTLINNFKIWAYENNVKIIELKVCNNNTSAIKLYKSEGFTEFKTIMRVKI